MDLIRRNRPDTNNWSPIDQIFDEFSRLPSILEQGISHYRGTPSDFYETDNEVIVKVSVPGIDPKDINIQVADGSVTISGESSDEHQEQNRNFYQKQIRYGSFSQTFVLPTIIQPDKAEASFKNGLLTLNLPKSESAKPKHIQIKVDSSSSESKKKIK